MGKSMSAGVLAVLLASVAAPAPAQDADEVASLRSQLEQIKKENELLRKENDLLKKEIELQKKDGKARPEKAKPGTLSDLLTEGTVLHGTFRASQGPGHGEVTFTITARDGKRVKADSTLRQMQDNVEVSTSEGQVEGVVEGNRLSWSNVGSANKATSILFLKGDGLEGNYRTQAGISGTMGLRFAK